VEIYMQNQWSGKRVLVTGGCGFVGSHLVAKLVELGAEVSVFDNMSTGNPEWIPSSVYLYHGDMRDIGMLRAATCDREFVFHLAAHADVRRNMEHPWDVWSNNVDATLNLLTCMRADNVNGLAFASSGIVYDFNEGPYDLGICCRTNGRLVPVARGEHDPLGANSIYGASKIACEHLIKAFELETSLRAWRFRFAGLLGPRYTHGHVADFVNALGGSGHGYPQTAGFTISGNAGSFQVLGPTGAALKPDARYRLATLDFLLKGGDGTQPVVGKLKPSQIDDLGGDVELRDAIVAYLKTR